MADKFMYISNIDTQNYPFWRLQLVDETYRNSTILTNQSNSLKVFEVGNDKEYFVLY